MRAGRRTSKNPVRLPLVRPPRGPQAAPHGAQPARLGKGERRRQFGLGLGQDLGRTATAEDLLKLAQLAGRHLQRPLIVPADPCGELLLAQAQDDPAVAADEQDLEPAVGHGIGERGQHGQSHHGTSER
ncbi:MAG: hypothetical protein JO034_10775 [Singulisphaera sp.]|nr:hypothetical protein [Singulisphaera sp.]